MLKQNDAAGWYWPKHDNIPKTCICWCICICCLDAQKEHLAHKDFWTESFAPSHLEMDLVYQCILPTSRAMQNKEGTKVCQKHGRSLHPQQVYTLFQLSGAVCVQTKKNPVGIKGVRAWAKEKLCECDKRECGETVRLVLKLTEGKRLSHGGWERR